METEGQTALFFGQIELAGNERKYGVLTGNLSCIVLQNLPWLPRCDEKNVDIAHRLTGVATARNLVPGAGMVTMPLLLGINVPIQPILGSAALLSTLDIPNSGKTYANSSGILTLPSSQAFSVIGATGERPWIALY